MKAAGPPADFLSRLAARTLGLGPTGLPRSPTLFEPPPAPSDALDSPEEGEAVRTAARASKVGPAPAVTAVESAVPAETAILAPAPAPVVANAVPEPPLSAAPPPSPAEPAPAQEPRRNATVRLIHAAEAGDATAAGWEEREPLGGKQRDVAPAAAAVVSARARAPGPRPAAIVPAMPRPADREPDPVGEKPASPAAPAPAAAPPIFATPAAISFALRDGPPNASPNGAGVLLPRRERRATPDREAPPPAGPSVNITIGRVEVRAAAPAATTPPAAPRPRGEAPQSLADYLKRRDRAR